MAERYFDYLDETGQKKKLQDLFSLCFKFALEGSSLDYHVSLSLVSEDKIHELNLKYRQKDTPTDVLTFAYEESEKDDLPFKDLGCIFICPEIAKKQAKEYHHPYFRELAFLFIHGLLHSLGYDHMEENDAEIMFSLQNSILNSLPYDFYTDLKKVKKLLLVAQNRAYTPYSNFKVGAVVLTKDGKYHLGCNIENSAYPDSICAERSALFSTYCSGYKKEDIVSLSLITSAQTIGTPCGSCRQVMSELMDENCPVYIFNRDFSKQLFTCVKDLLPYSFSKEDLDS